MATAGTTDDVTTICSVCLEPYKGRNPKLLPCFHTFCLPCLKVLEKHHEATLKNEVCDDDNGDKTAALTFPCPSCRTVIAVPPGGVSQFQTNFYLNHETVTCEVCDQGQEAKYSCTNCGHMCAQCQRYHDKFTSGHQVTPLTPSCQQSVQSSVDPTYKATIEQHLKALDASLMTMREEEETLQREMKAVADVISRRADDLKALVMQAEERGQRALAEVAEKLDKKIQEDIVTNREKYSRISLLYEQESSQGKNAISLNDVQALLSDDDLRHCQQRKRGQNQFLIPEFDESAIDMKAVEAYVGSVCDGTQLPGETNSNRFTVPVCGEGESVVKTESETHVKSLRLDIAHLESEMSDVKRTLAAIQACIDNLTEKTPNEVLEKELGILKTKLCSEEEDKLQTEQHISTIQKDLETFRKDILTNVEEKKLQTEQHIGTIQKDLETFKKNISSNVEEGKLQTERQIGTIQKDLETFKRNISTNREEDKLQAERKFAIIQKNLEIIQKNFDTFKRNISTITEGMADIKKEVKNIRENNSPIQKDIDKLKHEIAAMNKVNGRVQKDYDTLSRDLLAVKGKCSTMVAFSAFLRRDASFPCRNRIVMDGCMTNVGEAYNPQNGFFTAPVAGVYLFVATALRCEGRGRASLRLCSDNFNSGYSQSHEGSERLGVNCISHLTVKLSARQRVWLEAWSVTDLLSQYTSFSGVLVQPEM